MNERTKPLKKWQAVAGAAIIAVVVGIGVLQLNLADSSEASAMPMSDLEDVPGFRFVNGDMDEDQYEVEELAREYLVVECMAASGWEYTAAPSVVVEMNESGLTEEYVDPNDSITAALSEDQLSEYYLALYGTSSPDELVQEENTDNGCLQKAHAEIPGVFELASQLAVETDALEVEISNDPQTTEASAKWEVCMSEKGFKYGSVDELLTALQNEPAGQNKTSKAQLAEKENKNSCGPELRKDKRAAAVKHENAFVKKHKVVIEKFKKKHALAFAQAEKIVEAHQE